MRQVSVSFTVEFGQSRLWKRAMLLGDCGAARAVTVVVTATGVSDIMTMVRNVEDGKAMAQELLCQCRSINVSVHHFEIVKTKIARPEVVTNRTVVDLRLQDAFLTPPGFLTLDRGVCDFIYDPPITPLVKEAQ